MKEKKQRPSKHQKREFIDPVESYDDQQLDKVGESEEKPEKKEKPEK